MTDDAPQPLDVQRLRDSVPARVVRPGDPTYDLLRMPFNTRPDPRPSAIVRCMSEGDVESAVDFAVSAQQPVTVRGGGHSAEGWSSITDQVVIDLSGMQHIEVDLDNLLVQVSGGARWGQVDLATYPWGYVAPGGACTDVGAAGLTMGGGIGPVTRSYGMTIDSLVAARVVTSRDGKAIVVDAANEPELYWALRGGGGGNFGVATQFTYQMHPVLPAALGGILLFAWADMEALWKAYRNWMQADTDHHLLINPMVVWMGTDPGCALMTYYNGDPDTGMAVMKEMLGGLTPVTGPLEQSLQLTTLPAFTGGGETTAWPGTAQYWRSGFLQNDFPDDAISTIQDWFLRTPMPPTGTNHPAAGTGLAPQWRNDISFAFIESLGGAMGEVPVDDTAFFWRDQKFSFTVIGIFDPAIPQWAEATQEWAFGFRAAMEPYLSGGVYANYVQADLPDFGTAYYGDHYQRLRDVKAIYDPSHTFQFPQDLR
jgi:FAD/FMN-containing dehydrogenase